MSNAPSAEKMMGRISRPYDPKELDSPIPVTLCPRIKIDLNKGKMSGQMFEFEKEMLSAIAQIQKDIAEIKEYIRLKETENERPN